MILLNLDFLQGGDKAAAPCQDCVCYIRINEVIVETSAIGKLQFLCLVVACRVLLSRKSNSDTPVLTQPKEL